MIDRRFELSFSVLAFACLALIGCSIGGLTSDALIAPGGVMLAACVTALTALRINESFGERRLKTLRAQRKEAYESLIKHTISQFTTSYEGGQQREAEIRAGVVLWGSPELIEVMGEWYELIRQLPPSGSVDPSKRRAYQLQVAKIASLARQDAALANGGVVTVSELAEIIFDDFVA